MSTASDIEDRAAGWLLRREEPGWSTEDQAALDAWLAASSLHRVAYYRLEYGWRKADRLAAVRAQAAPERASGFAMPQFNRAAAIAALLVGAIVGGAYIFGDQDGGASVRTYATEIGGRSSFPLEDGSQVELNTNSELRTALDAKSRTAWLDRGEAYFAVAHDAGRPFVIHAGPRLVKVLGTKFSVWRDGDRLVVSVLEGRVEVDVPPASQAIAVPGDVVTVEGDVETVRHEALDRVVRDLSWREGILTFDQDSLAEAARQFNRYNRKKIVVDSGAANAIHIGGTFDAENVEGFARLLQEAYRLTVKDKGGEIVVSGKKPSR
jgi:transmembrane sensor